MPTNHLDEQKQMSFEEFLRYSEQIIADGIIREGFKTIRSSMYSIVNVYEQCKKEGFKEEY